MAENYQNGEATIKACRQCFKAIGNPLSQEGLPKAKECTKQFLTMENEACATLIAELTPGDMEKGEKSYIALHYITLHNLLLQEVKLLNVLTTLWRLLTMRDALESQNPLKSTMFSLTELRVSCSPGNMDTNMSRMLPGRINLAAGDSR